MIYSAAIRVFCAVMRQGSFTQAAIDLDLSGPAVSKQIKALEQRLGVRLFQRTTRTISPTEAAERLYRVLLGQDGQIQALFDEWASAQIEPTGRLKLAVPMAFGERFLHRPLLHYALRYPKVTVDVEFDDRRVHLLEGGYDLALRIGALEDSGLNCPTDRKLPDIPLRKPRFSGGAGAARAPRCPRTTAVNCLQQRCPDLELRGCRGDSGARHATTPPGC